MEMTVVTTFIDTSRSSYKNVVRPRYGEIAAEALGWKLPPKP